MFLGKISPHVIQKMVVDLQERKKQLKEARREKTKTKVKKHVKKRAEKLHLSKK